MTMAYHRYHGLDTRIVRIFNTYGPRMRLNDGRALPNFLYQALVGEPITVYGDGKQTRSFCYVSDLLAGIYKLLESNEHEPTNIGNPQEITILEFAERVRKLVGATTPIVFHPLPQDDPEAALPRHHQSQAHPELGTKGNPGRRPATHLRIFPRKSSPIRPAGKIIASWDWYNFGRSLLDANDSSPQILRSSFIATVLR